MRRPPCFETPRYARLLSMRPGESGSALTAFNHASALVRVACRLGMRRVLARRNLRTDRAHAHEQGSAQKKVCGGPGPSTKEARVQRGLLGKAQGGNKQGPAGKAKDRSQIPKEGTRQQLQVSSQEQIRPVAG